MFNGRLHMDILASVGDSLYQTGQGVVLQYIIIFLKKDVNVLQWTEPAKFLL